MGRKRAKDEPAPEPAPEEPDPPIVVSVTWEGIEVEVTYKPHDIMAWAHLELRTDKRQILPVTETGYRSEFVPPGLVEAEGGPEAYVLAWLTREAQRPAWKRKAEAARQLSLF